MTETLDEKLARLMRAADEAEGISLPVRTYHYSENIVVTYDEEDFCFRITQTHLPNFSVLEGNMHKLLNKVLEQNFDNIAIYDNFFVTRDRGECILRTSSKGIELVLLRMPLQQFIDWCKQVYKEHEAIIIQYGRVEIDA